jgi:hypothetical protein
MNPPKPRAAERIERPAGPRRSLPKVRLAINWRLLVSYLLRPAAVVSLSLAVLFAAMYTYLYFRF